MIVIPPSGPTRLKANARLAPVSPKRPIPGSPDTVTSTAPAFSVVETSSRLHKLNTLQCVKGRVDAGLGDANAVIAPRTSVARATK